mgnify:CR=1 FL=1
MPPWTAAHDDAVRSGRPRYVDPATGYQVFTEATLVARGRCCGSACRHCPYGHERVRSPPTTRGPGQPTWRRLHPEAPEEVDVVVWDGDTRVVGASGRSVVLLVPHPVGDERTITEALAAAVALDAELITVPVGPDRSADIQRTLTVIRRRSPRAHQPCDDR